MLKLRIELTDTDSREINRRIFLEENNKLCSEKEITLLSPVLLPEAMDTNNQLSTTTTLGMLMEQYLEDITLNMVDLLENSKLQEAGKLKSNTLILKQEISSKL